LHWLRGRHARQQQAVGSTGAAEPLFGVIMACVACRIYAFEAVGQKFTALEVSVRILDSYHNKCKGEYMDTGASARAFKTSGAVRGQNRA